MWTYGRMGERDAERSGQFASDQNRTVQTPVKHCRWQTPSKGTRPGGPGPFDRSLNRE